MQDRQKIFFISAIVILTMIVLVEGVFLLRNSPRWHDWTASVSRTFHSEKEDIILQETAEDLERMQNQINRLLYEMTRDTPFARQNISGQDRHDRQNPFAALRSKLRCDLPSPTEAGLREGGSTSHPSDNIQRLQAEIAHIFQRAHDSRHNNALHLIEQDWGDVGEISFMNMEEDGTNYIVTVSMPGFNKTDISVNLTGRILTVEAGPERQGAAQNSQAVPAAAQAGSSSRFKTQIMLPGDITGESAHAFYEDSILKIMIPKKPASNSLARKVTIM